jgi:intracellular multiplication protein IcmT
MYSWRDTYKTPKFFFMDARISFFILATLLHISFWTFGTTLVIACFLYYFEKRRNMGLESSLRMIRAKMAGFIRPATIYSKNRYPIDYNRIMMNEKKYLTHTSKK